MFIRQIGLAKRARLMPTFTLENDFTLIFTKTSHLESFTLACENVIVDLATSLGYC
ncbi:MAG: hypothetical protein ACEY26_00285 [Candidatus Hodgkinia cicadicola]